jgi:hypothetical protein
LPQEKIFMQKSVNINLGAEITLGSIERCLKSHFEATKAAPRVVFDLTNASWAGTFPLSLLFSWCGVLQPGRDDREVRIALPQREALSHELQKVLLHSGLLGEFRALGVQVPFFSSPKEETGLHFQHIALEDSDHGDIEQLAKRIGNRISPGSFGRLVDPLRMIVAELVENAFYHGVARLPHIGLSFSTSTGSRRNPIGVIRVFEKGCPYAELVIGDIGIGIHKKLAAYMPSDYSPPFPVLPSRLTKPEKVISFGFEFDSTSDNESRRRRIKRILETEDIEPTLLATGLFCTLGVVRSRGGQLVVRTPKNMLSADYAEDPEKPQVKGRAELGIGALADLPGTHFLLRIPLREHHTRQSHLFVSEAFVNTRDIVVCNPMTAAHPSDDSAALLRRAFKEVEAYVTARRRRGGLLLIRPIAGNLSPRAWSLFLLSLRSMMLGQLRVVVMSYTGNAAEAPPIAEPTESFHNQGILVGDLLDNAFVILGMHSPHWWSILGQTNPDGTFSFADTSHTALLEKNQEFIHRELARALQEPDIRLSPGPFLINEEYYTDVFYHVEHCLASAETRSLFVEWCLATLPTELEVIVATTNKVASAAEEIAQEFERRYGRRTPVITVNVGKVLAQAIAQTLAFSKKHAALLTDVICRGLTIKNMAEALGNLDLLCVVTVVDARPIEDIGEPLAVGFGEEKKLIRVTAPHFETIRPFSDPPTRGVLPSEEHVYVVDPTVGTPTLHKRLIKPGITPAVLFREVLPECGGLMFGHRAQDDRHYSISFDFPRVFAALEDHLRAWVKSQIGFVTLGSKPEEVTFFLYNIDNGLLWLPTFLWELNPGCTIQSVSWDQISAPGPEAKRQNASYVVILPATESGETARRFAEFASRFGPRKLLILAVVSRLSSYQYNFFTGIYNYRDAEFRVSFFLDLPIRAYLPGPGSCPMCTEVSELERLLGITRRRRSAPHLEETLARKIAVAKAQSVELEGDEIPHVTSQRDSSRAFIRALYEAAEVDHDSRLDLAQSLARTEMVDRFLEVISLERRSGHFSRQEIARRLGHSFAVVKQRAAEIVLTAKPPFPIGRLVGALIHLVPREFLLGVASLVDRFALAQRDVEDICIGLLLEGEEPPRLAEAIKRLHELDQEEAFRLMTEALDLLKVLSAPEDAVLQAGVDGLAQFFAGLFRSGYFGDYCRTLGDSAWRSEMAAGMRGKCEAIIQDWRVRLLEELERAYNSPFWTKVANRHASLADDIFECLWRAVQKINRSRQQLIGILKRLFPEAVGCAPARLQEITTVDGVSVRVRRDIDWSAPEIFCDLGSMEYAVSQIMSNWMKYATRDSELAVKLTQSGQLVNFDFMDSIPGSYDLGSEGGLRVIREICETYGGSLGILEGSPIGRKTLRLSFRKAPIAATDAN